LFPYTTLFRSDLHVGFNGQAEGRDADPGKPESLRAGPAGRIRSHAGRPLPASGFNRFFVIAPSPDGPTGPRGDGRHCDGRRAIGPARVVQTNQAAWGNNLRRRAVVSASLHW